jgi:RNA polymerase sigma-70 factor (ECF subfamily)
MSDENRRFQKLLRELRGGSQDAARELAETYGEHVRRCVRYRLPRRLRGQYDSLDFVQIVWTSVFTDPDKLADVHEPEQFIKYLAGVARNKVVTAGRRHFSQKNNVEREVRVDENASVVGPHPAGRDPTPSTLASFNEQWDNLVEKQPPDERLIIAMRFEGNTVEEVAKRLSVDKRTAQRIITRLRTRLQ